MCLLQPSSSPPASLEANLGRVAREGVDKPSRSTSNGSASLAASIFTSSGVIGGSTIARSASWSAIVDAPNVLEVLVLNGEAGGADVELRVPLALPDRWTSAAGRRAPPLWAAHVCEVVERTVVAGDAVPRSRRAAANLTEWAVAAHHRSLIVPGIVGVPS
jgi:hypothetical protein